MFPRPFCVRWTVAIGLWAALLMTHGAVCAQGSGTIRGRVYDRETGDPLPYANVVIQNTSFGTPTDLEGRFTLRNVPAGQQTIRVTYVGYATTSRTVTVTDNGVLEEEFRLSAQTITGETVVITAQAQGQNAAINQQLSSNTISNVVSQARIRELPDVNAAESIGRLPGVSIARSGGEASRIEIRGLSAKYNTVTINGVQVPATGGDDRSVDLSLISANILDGIEVKKAITPDMDADVLGGTVDLRLKEAPEEMKVHFTGQWGYNALQNYYGNYNLAGSVSDRFLDNDLGVVLGVNADNYDRSADKYSGVYRQTQQSGTNLTQIVVQSVSLREEQVTRDRLGGSLMLDYRIPNGKVTADAIYNRLSSDRLYRINRMNVNDNRHYYDMEDRGGSTSIFTGSAGVRQDWELLGFDVTVSRTASRTEDLGDRTWTFAQENTAFQTGAITPDTHPREIPGLATIDTVHTGLSSMYIYDTRRKENQTALQLNIKVPFQVGDMVNGYVKLGGKLRWLDRDNDEEQYGRDGLQYGSTTSVNTSLTRILQSLSTTNPSEWNWFADSSLIRRYGVFPISRVIMDYARTDFLDGEYPLGFVMSPSLMNQMMDAFRGTPEYLRYATGSIGRDYDGEERYQAAYLMAEFEIGGFLTVLPGVRWEKDYSLYHGQRYREVSLNNIQGDPADLAYLTNERRNEFWLPMLHLTATPTDWLKIRLARTETLTRPDYIQYAPITYINSYQSYGRAANADLKPALSVNYDAAVSVYESYVGFFSVSGFYKEITDLIFQTRYDLQRGITPLPGMNIPESWYQQATPQFDTYINNPYEATYKGFELEWQTHFWYLPSVFHGIVLNVNYTRIYSDTEKRLYYLVRGDRIPGPGPPRYAMVIKDSSRTARMPDQPAHIVNVTLGYDFEGFSARLSYLYQTDKVTFIDREPILDNFTGEYSRWDLTLQQKLDWGLVLFANFTNLTATPDEQFRGYTLTSPAYTEYYGFAMDVGIRFNL